MEQNEKDEMKKCNLATLLLLLLFSIHFQAKSSQLILYQNDTLFTESDILSSFDGFKNLRTSLLQLVSKTCRNVGYSTKIVWVIQDDKLFLKDFLVKDFCTGVEIPTDLSNHFSNNGAGLYFADWFSNNVDFGKGEIINEGFSNKLYSCCGKLNFSNGILINQENWKNDVVTSEYNTSEKRNRLIYTNIDWSKIRKRHLKKGYVVQVKFQTNDTTGVIKNKHVPALWSFSERTKTPKYLEQEALRVVDLIPSWNYFLENGKPYPQHHVIIEVQFSEALRIQFLGF